MTTEELKAAFKLAQERAEKLSLVSQENIVKHILQEIEEAEWNETLASPESHAYQEKAYTKLEEDIRTGTIKNYFTDDNLEELF
jgi:hypothetical protein